MKPLITLVLCVSLLAPGCAVRSSVDSRMVPGRSGVQGSDIPRSYAQELPAGKEVEIRLRNGEHFKGTFMGVEGETIRVQPSTRIPVPPRVVPLSDVIQLRLTAGGGTSVAKAILIGAASGAAVFFGLLLMSIAQWAD